jgi:hypothetical protein
VLEFLFRHWRPDGRAARPEDRFPFLRAEVALVRILAGHRRQIFLPVPGRAPEAIAGEIPDTPQLARMRFLVESETLGAVATERDAYSFLRLLVASEQDFGARWKNQLGQELSVDLLLRHAWRRYLEVPSAEAEREDHSALHLVEILLSYHHRGLLQGTAAARPNPNALKRRFVAFELSRPVHETDDESLVHYVESLGWLLADSHVSWSAEEGAQLKAWLQELEEERFPELAALEETHLAHLLGGLRRIGRHWNRLDPLDRLDRRDAR